MGSTFRELYSDFQDATRIYTEKLSMSEVRFMRLYSRGIQRFQKDTEIMERVLLFNKAAAEPYFTIPNDCLRIIQIKDVNENGNGRLAVPMGVKQRDVYNEKTAHNLGFDIRLSDYHKGYDASNGSTRYSIHDNDIRFYRNDTPYEPEQVLIFYKPDIPAFGQPEGIYNYVNYWNAWYPIETNFQDMFETVRVSPLLAAYEEAFLNYAIMKYIMSAGSPNFKEYERLYKEEVEFAKINKPDYTHNSTPDYNCAPWS